MVTIAKKFFEKYFPLYFALCLLGFTIIIFLMNLPRVLASEPNNIEILIKNAPIIEPAYFEWDEKYPLRWEFPMAKKADIIAPAMEFKGNRMLFRFNF